MNAQAQYKHFEEVIIPKGFLCGMSKLRKEFTGNIVHIDKDENGNIFYGVRFFQKGLARTTYGSIKNGVLY